MKLTLMLFAAVALLSAEGTPPVKQQPPPNPMPCPSAILLPHVCMVAGV